MPTVNTRPLKIKAANFSEPVKSLILSEPDVMDGEDFVIKVCAWLKLVEMGRGAGK